VSDKLIEAVVGIATAVIGLALISVIFGSKQTSGVLKSAGSAFQGIIGAAVKPASS
jgi:hypothetical protein